MKKISWLLVSFLVITPVLWSAESDVDRLLDLLTDKNVVTKEDAAGFRADLAIKKQDEKEAQREFSLIAGKPIKISGYTQVRYQTFQEKGKIATFDVRRARLDIKGDITKQLDYRLQSEFGGGTSVKLLDATIGYKFDDFLKLTLGQFKIPFSQENLLSSPKLETINRSPVVESLVARGKDIIGNQNGRDIGVQTSGSLLSIKDNYILDYVIGIFNGAGINTTDTNVRKDFVGRLVRTIGLFYNPQEFAGGI